MTAIIVPNTDTAFKTVEDFIQNIQIHFLNVVTSKDKIKEVFPLIFNKSAKHLMDKYVGYSDFAPFFLNLDNDCKADLLAYLGIEGAKDYPTIDEKYIQKLEAKHPDIVAYGKKAAMYYWRQFLSFGNTLNQYQLYSMVLIVLQRTLLFFNNRGIVENVDGFNHEDFNEYLRTYEGVFCANSCKMLRAKDNLKSILLHGHIKYLHKTDKMSVYKSQGANGINNFRSDEMIKKENIPFPINRDDLKLLANELEIFNTLNSNLRYQNRLLKESRDILLPRLMSGAVNLTQ